MIKPFSDKIAMVGVAIGVVLMVLTVLTRVNPAEGSVVRPEFLHTPSGKVIAVFLLITSLPGWGGVMLCAPLGAVFQNETSVWMELFLFQILGYWVLGKVISIGWRKWRRERMARVTGEVGTKDAHANAPEAGQ